MRTIVEDTISQEEIDLQGQLLANQILNEVKNGELLVTDKKFRQFLCVLFAQGNLEFLKVLAEKYYPDESRKDVILDFINLVEKTTKEGQEELHREVNEKLKLLHEKLGV